MLLLNVATWLQAFEHREAVLLYCSDVSGAFDRVPSDRLRQKLFLTGMHPKLFAVLSDWLRGRESSVVVKGSESEWGALLV